MSEVTNTSRGPWHRAVGHAPRLGAETLHPAGQPALGGLVPTGPPSAGHPPRPPLVAPC